MSPSSRIVRLLAATEAHWTKPFPTEEDYDSLRPYFEVAKSALAKVGLSPPPLEEAGLMVYTPGPYGSYSMKCTPRRTQFEDWKAKVVALLLAAKEIEADTNGIDMQPSPQNGSNSPGVMSDAPSFKPNGTANQTSPDEQMSPVSRAVALILEASRKRTLIKQRDVYKAIGFDRSMFTRNDQLKSAWKLYKEQMRGDAPPRGSKDAKGNLEAYDDE